MSAEELTCQELVELVTAYIEGALTADARARFDAHLAICPGCINHLEQMQRTIDMLGTLPEAAISAQARDELLAVFRRWKQA